MNKLNTTTKCMIIALVIVLLVIIIAECDAESRINRDTSGAGTVELAPSESEVTAEPDGTTADPAATDAAPSETNDSGTTDEA